MNLADYAPLFRCPTCRGELSAHAPTSVVIEGFTCATCRVRYPVRDGIVNFTPADAEALPPADARS